VEKIWEAATEARVFKKALPELPRWRGEVESQQGFSPFSHTNVWGKQVCFFGKVGKEHLHASSILNMDGCRRYASGDEYGRLIYRAQKLLGKTRMKLFQRSDQGVVTRVDSASAITVKLVSGKVVVMKKKHLRLLFEGEGTAVGDAVRDVRFTKLGKWGKVELIDADRSNYTVKYKFEGDVAAEYLKKQGVEWSVYMKHMKDPTCGDAHGSKQVREEEETEKKCTRAKNECSQAEPEQVPSHFLCRCELKKGDAVECSCDDLVPEPYTDTHLLVWAIFSHRRKIARKICEDCNQPMLAAFLAAYLYRQIIAQDEEVQAYKDELKEEIKFFDDLATSVLDHIPTFADATHVLSGKVETDPANRGEESILAAFLGVEFTLMNRVDLALEADNKTFLAHRSVQQHIDNTSRFPHNSLWFFWHRWMFALWVVVYAVKKSGWGDLVLAGANEVYRETFDNPMTVNDERVPIETLLSTLLGAFIGACMRVDTFVTGIHLVGAWLYALLALLPVQLSMYVLPGLDCTYTSCLWIQTHALSCFSALPAFMRDRIEVRFVVGGLLGYCLFPIGLISFVTDVYLWLYFISFVFSEMKQCSAQWEAGRSKQCEAQEAQPQQPVQQLAEMESSHHRQMKGAAAAVVGTLVGSLVFDNLGASVFGVLVLACWCFQGRFGASNHQLMISYDTVLACFTSNDGIPVIVYGACVGALQHLEASGSPPPSPLHSPYGPYGLLLWITFASSYSALGAFSGFMATRVIASIRREDLNGNCVTSVMLREHLADWFNVIDFVIIVIFVFSMFQPALPIMYFLDYSAHFRWVRSKQELPSCPSWLHPPLQESCSTAVDDADGRWFRTKHQDALKLGHCINFIYGLGRGIYMLSYGSHGKVLLTLVLGTYQIVKTQVAYFFMFYMLLVIAFVPTAKLLDDGQNNVWTLVFGKDIADSNQYLSYAFFLAFSLFNSVVLDNILGARVTNHHDALDETAEHEWKKMRVVLVREYAVMEGFPPPFNLIHDSHRILGVNRICPNKFGNNPNKFGKKSKELELRRHAKELVQQITALVPQCELKDAKNPDHRPWVRPVAQFDPFLRLVEAERKAIAVARTKAEQEESEGE
jgi:hypothetical protein